jgi:cytochrome P450
MHSGWSWLFGHSLVILKYTKCLPSSANVVLAMKNMSKEFAETEMFLMDMWPGYPTSLIVFNPEALNLVSHKWNLPRPPQSLEAIKPIVGGHNLVSMNGTEWKMWRSLLNPGFSPANLNNHVSFIVDCAQTFCDKLRESAGKGIMSLDEYATRLTFDVIMKVTLSVFHVEAM